MKEIVIDGVPVVLGRSGKPGRNHRMKPLPRKTGDKSIWRYNRKQKQALKNFMEGGGDPTNKALKKKSAEDAGYSPAYAPRAMEKILQNKAIVQALEEVGATDKFVAQIIKNGMFKSHDPKNPELPGYETILKYVQEFNRIKGHHAPTKIESEHKSIHIHLTADDADAFQRFMQDRVRFNQWFCSSHACGVGAELSRLGQEFVSVKVHGIVVAIPCA